MTLLPSILLPYNKPSSYRSETVTVWCIPVRLEHPFVLLLTIASTDNHTLTAHGDFIARLILKLEPYMCIVMQHVTVL